MSVISGLTGSITYASGYVVLCDAWHLMLNAALQDGTPLSPTSGHQQLLAAAALKGGAGRYHCKLAVDEIADYSGVSYNTNPEEWSFMSMCEARETTQLKAAWRTFVAGLINSGFEAVSYIDNITVLPLPGTSGTTQLTVTTGKNYEMGYIVGDIDVGVSTNDEARRINMRALASAAPTSNGGLPVAGTTGSATFVAYTGRQYAAAGILVTGILCRVNRRASYGDITVDFVLNGALTPG